MSTTQVNSPSTRTEQVSPDRATHDVEVRGAFEGGLPRWLTYQQAAFLLARSPSNIAKLVRARVITGSTFSGTKCVLSDDVIEMASIAARVFTLRRAA